MCTPKILHQNRDYAYGIIRITTLIEAHYGFTVYAVLRADGAKRVLFRTAFVSLSSRACVRLFV